MITQFLEKQINKKEHNDNSTLLALKGLWNSYVFSLFLGEVMIANEFETKEK